MEEQGKAWMGGALHGFGKAMRAARLFLLLAEGVDELLGTARKVVIPCS
jgi:hypothetical protein